MGAVGGPRRAPPPLAGMGGVPDAAWLPLFLAPLQELSTILRYKLNPIIIVRGEGACKNLADALHTN